MATTTNYSWSTPDDTALVKDGAAAIRSLGTAIDSTVFTNAGAAIAKTIVDAKGDIIAATAADTVSRLAVGANDTILTADSSTATGLKWAAPAASGGMTLISTTSLTSGSTVTLSSIPQTYKHLLLLISNVTATSDHYMDVKPNDTTDLRGHVIDARGSSNINYDSDNKVRLNLGTAQRASGGNSSSAIDFYNYVSTTLKKHVRGTYFFATGADVSASGHTYGTFTTSAISSLTINTNSTFTAGTALLYGVS